MKGIYVSYLGATVLVVSMVGLISVITGWAFGLA